MKEKGLKIYKEKKYFFLRSKKEREYINSQLINYRRSNLIKSYRKFNYNKITKDDLNDVYSLYLESIDEYIIKKIYKRVKENNFNPYERNLVTRYYQTIQNKKEKYNEYKFKKQLLLLKEDFNYFVHTKKEQLKFQDIYFMFIEKTYKGLIKEFIDSSFDYQNASKSFEVLFKILYELLTEIHFKFIDFNENENSIYKFCSEDVNSFLDVINSKNISEENTRFFVNSFVKILNNYFKDEISEDNLIEIQENLYKVDVKKILLNANFHINNIQSNADIKTDEQENITNRNIPNSFVEENNNVKSKNKHMKEKRKRKHS